MKKELLEQRIEKAKSILSENPYYQMGTSDLFTLLEPVFIGGGLTAIECLKVLSSAMQSVSTWEYVKQITKEPENAIQAFNTAWDLYVNTNDYPDCARFDKEFFNEYDCTVNSPMHLMFKSFIMGLDFVLG